MNGVMNDANVDTIRAVFSSFIAKSSYRKLEYAE